MTVIEGWQLSGAGAETYECFQVPSVLAPLAHVFLDAIPIRLGNRVLDVACGTGIVGRLAASLVGPAGQIVGVDLNDEMLAVARRQPIDGDVMPVWRQGDASALPCDAAAFDVVLCQQGLQFVPDRSAALNEMHRVLVPGGIVALCVWQSIDQSPMNTASAAALARHIGEDAAMRLHAPFALGDRGELRRLLGAAGFRDIVISAAVITRRMLPPEISIPQALASTPVGPQVAVLDAVTQATLVAEIACDLEAYRDADGLAVPQATHIALAWK